VIRDLVYTTGNAGSPQRLDVYLPGGAAPRGGWPVVLAIHGGGWWQFSKEQYGSKVAPTLTRSGFAVVAPNYELAAPGRPSWPVNFEQIRQAVAWVRAHAAEYGLDATRLAAMGESAGAHLAALLGTSPKPGEADPSRVGAVVSFSGPADLAALAGNSPAGYFAARQMLGADVAADPSRYAAASPTRLASPGDAPTLIFQGTADTIVPPDQGQGLAAVLTAANVPNRLVLIPGAGHGVGFPAVRRGLVPKVVGFLREALAISRQARR
jgi:acetyl esterase/lipase